MTPNFTNINYILSTLYSFSKKEFAFDFSESMAEPGEDLYLFSTNEHLKFQIEHFDSLFELAEGEINQTVAGYNPIIINSLFQYIKSHRQHIYPKPDNLLEKIKVWNDESYSEYEKKVLERSASYFPMKNLRA